MRKNYCGKLYGIGDLRYEETGFPECGKDEVLVEVKNCGICGSDLNRVYGNGAYHYPIILGHEFSGKVVYDRENKLIGKKVSVFPLLPCFECESCKSGNYATCKSYDYYGSRRDGGMAEYIAVKRWNILIMDDNLSYEEGAMCEPVSVARHAVMKCRIEKGNNLFVSGAGPIGLIIGQWAKNLGAENVYYIDTDDKKIEFAQKSGFMKYTEDVVIDCAIEGTGCSDALEQCLKAVKPQGRMVLMGNPKGEVLLSQNTYWYILRKELVLSGTWNSSYNDLENDWKESLKAMAEGKINVKSLITHRYPLSDGKAAFEMMKDKTEFFNKVMLVTEGSDS